MQLALLIGALVLPIGAAVLMLVRSLPRDEDYYALHLADLMQLTNSRSSQRDSFHPAPPTGGVVKADDAAFSYDKTIH
jgi:hypothetical protein